MLATMTVSVRTPVRPSPPSPPSSSTLTRSFPVKALASTGSTVADTPSAKTVWIRLRWTEARWATSNAGNATPTPSIATRTVPTRCCGRVVDSGASIR